MDHKFKKQFGQNFLQNVIWVEQMVDTAQLSNDDIVVEIGPGAGFVTERLSQNAGQVFALEIDTELYADLHEKFDNTNVTILEQDILQWDFKQIAAKPYKVVASLPYNISKKIINMFLKSANPPVQMALLIQKEVAYDYVAQKPNASFLGTAAQLFADISFAGTVPRSAFFPEPKVDGGILQFKNIRPKLENPEQLIKFIKIGYSAPRKKLSANISNLGYDKTAIEKLLIEHNLSATARAQELDLNDWIALNSAVATIAKTR